MFASFLDGFTDSTFDESDVYGELQLISPSLLFADNDGTLDTHGMVITVSGLLAEDIVSLKGSARIYLDGASIMYDYDGDGAGSAQEVGIASGGVGGDFQMVFNTWGEVGVVELVLEHLAYGNSSNDPTATRDLRIETRGVDGKTNLWEDPWSLGGYGVSSGATIGLFDMNGDGHADLFNQYQGALHYVLGNGAGGFGGVSYFAIEDLAGSSATPTGFDVNGDGRLDLVLGIPDGTIAVHLNNGDGTFDQTRLATHPFLGIDVSGMSAPTFGDLDGDGDLDLVVGADGELHLYRNDAGVFTAAGSETVGQGRLAPALFDADSDGDLDIIFGDGTGAFAVIAMNGFTFGALTSHYETWDFGANGGVAAADLNGDGYADVMITGETNGNSQSLYRMFSRFGQSTVTITVNAQGPTPTAGADTLAGTAGDDAIDGLAGDDILDGGAGDDALTGGDGNDYLRGGSGADTMVGGLGNDTYVVTDAGDTADETGGDGIDTVMTLLSFTLGAGLDNLTLTAPGGAIDGTGNALDNVILGNAFENVLTGLDGADTLSGGGRNDILYGGNGDDILDGGQHDDELFGGADHDVLTGGTGNDRLDGGAGADDMTGGAGNDIYVVDDLGDTVTELAGQGTDTVQSSIDWELGDNVENLILTGTADLYATGNGLRNIIIGSDGNDRVYAGAEMDAVSGGAGFDQLYGEAGNDILNGDAGLDILYGGDGNDVLNGGADIDFLYGGAGNDKLTGGGGQDVFVFDQTDITNPVGRDEILDLTFADGDVIDLSDIDANSGLGGDQAFVWAARFTKVAGQAVLTYSGGITTLSLDVNGDGAADFRIAITGDHTGTTGNLYAGIGDGNGGWVL